MDAAGGRPLWQRQQQLERQWERQWEQQQRQQRRRGELPHSQPWPACLAAYLADCLADCLADSLADCLAGCLAGCFGYWSCLQPAQSPRPVPLLLQTAYPSPPNPHHRPTPHTTHPTPTPLAQFPMGGATQTQLKYAVEIVIPRSTRMLGVLEPLLERTVFEDVPANLAAIKQRVESMQVRAGALCLPWGFGLGQQGLGGVRLFL